jgi:NADPH:quinone reductase-like Zn-dependent oxidoreductase
MKAMKLTCKTGLAQAIEVDKPSVGPNEVLVQVKYSTICPALDAVVQKSFTGMFVHSRTNPLILGWHYVGKVVEMGADVKELAVEDEVWGFLQYASGQKQGAYAEFIKIHPDECARKPKNTSFETVAATSTESLTALQAMRNYGGLAEGKSILILGAGGGVGSAAVQIAKNLGAHVTAVCSTKDVDRVKAFGADVVIDRSKDDPLGGETTYDVIFDTPAQYSATKCIGKLRPKGCYVTTLPTGSLVMGMILSLFTGKGSKLVECNSNRADLELVGSWLTDKKLSIDVDSTFDIKDLEEAIERQNNRAKVGRVVIKVEGGW